MKGVFVTALILCSLVTIALSAIAGLRSGYGGGRHNYGHRPVHYDSSSSESYEHSYGSRGSYDSRHSDNYGSDSDDSSYDRRPYHHHHRSSESDSHRRHSHSSSSSSSSEHHRSGSSEQHHFTPHIPTLNPFPTSTATSTNPPNTTTAAGGTTVSTTTAATTTTAAAS